MNTVRILFVCTENACRSQMAEAFTKKFGKKIIKAYSAGSAPAKTVNDKAVKVLKELGINISNAKPKRFDDLPTKDFDFVVTMGCENTCPFVNAQTHIAWQIIDPKQKGIDVFRQVREQIKEKVEDLVEQIYFQIKHGGEIMERHFDDELAKLKKDLLRIAALVEKAIQESIEALTKQDISLAKEVVEQDSKIDELELAIEEHAIGLLALRQPMARDLRFITTGMKIDSELERIADLAENIAQRVIELGNEPLLKPLIDIPKLAEVARKMVKLAIDSFVNQDESLAKKVILSDTEADKLRNSINEELINNYMMVDSATIRQAVALLLVARHLERICDHASYIAADIIYMIKAKVVKHHPERLKNNHK